jgi:hypothetical protein
MLFAIISRKDKLGFLIKINGIIYNIFSHICLADNILRGLERIKRINDKFRYEDFIIEFINR